MKYKVLKALLGKHISSKQHITYCHVDRIIVIEGTNAIVTAIVKTLNDRVFHWFLEVSWTTDRYGFHSISSCKILKEDELDGYNGHTAQDQAL